MVLVVVTIISGFMEEAVYRSTGNITRACEKLGA